MIFSRKMYGDKVNNTCRTSNEDTIFTRRRSLAWTIRHIFSNLYQNRSKIVSVDEIMGNKTNVMIGQRISRLRKSRRKRDFSPLSRNAAFFSISQWETISKQGYSACIAQFHLVLCSWLHLKAVVKTAHRRHRAQRSCYDFSRFFFFFLLFQTDKTRFFLMNYNQFLSTAQENELIVYFVSNDWGITETVPSTCPISSRPEGWHFQFHNKHHQIKTHNNNFILCITPSFIHSLVFIPLQCNIWYLLLYNSNEHV